MSRASHDEHVKMGLDGEIEPLSRSNQRCLFPSNNILRYHNHVELLSTSLMAGQHGLCD